MTLATASSIFNEIIEETVARAIADRLESMAVLLAEALTARVQAEAEAESANQKAAAASATSAALAASQGEVNSLRERVITVESTAVKRVDALEARNEAAATALAAALAETARARADKRLQVNPVPSLPRRYEGAITGRNHLHRVSEMTFTSATGPTYKATVTDRNELGAPIKVSIHPARQT